MALISPRIANNLAKNGYYPTDDKTVSGIINCFERHDDPMWVLDPCVGEGIAVSNLAYSISMNSQIFGVEYHQERASIATKRCDHILRSDVFDTVITPQSFGLLFLNPPYGDLTRENTGAIVNYQKDYKRLEKIFYRFTLPMLAYDGIMVLIIPFTQLDDVLSNWIASQFTDISTYLACDKQFKQIVIMGRKVRQSDITLNEKNDNKMQFKQIFEEKFIPDEIGLRCQQRYNVPKPKTKAIKSFFKLSFTDDEFESELKKNRHLGLWGHQAFFTQHTGEVKRQPLCQMSDWHLSLALAAGEISGMVKSETGKTYVIKGDTYKIQHKSVTTNYEEDGSLSDTQTVLTDRFIPSIKAWDFTEGADTFGSLLIISSAVSQPNENVEDEIDNTQTCAEDNDPKNTMYVENQRVKVGEVFTTRGVKSLISDDVNKATLVHGAFKRYCLADWGDMCDSDLTLNDKALKQGQKEDRLFASYDVPDVGKIWIITEWHCDRENFVTTLMLPNEY